MVLVALTILGYGSTAESAQCLPPAANPARNLFIIAGQSNAAGLAATDRPSSPFSPDTHFDQVQIYGFQGAPAVVLDRDNASLYRSVDWSAAASWGTARPGYGSKDLGYYRSVINPAAQASDLSGLYGAELPFAALLSHTPPYEHYLIKLAIGGTTLAPNGDPVSPDWAPGSFLYRELLEMIADAYNAKRAGVTLHIAGLFWMQGESDALDGLRAANYQASLAAFVAHFRASLSEMGCPVTKPDFPVIVGRIQDNPALPYREQVRNAQEAIAQSPMGVRTLSTDGLQRLDRVHFGESGQAELGTRLYDAFHEQGALAVPDEPR